MSAMVSGTAVDVSTAPEYETGLPSGSPVRWMSSIARLRAKFGRMASPVMVFSTTPAISASTVRVCPSADTIPKVTDRPTASLGSANDESRTAESGRRISGSAPSTSSCSPATTSNRMPGTASAMGATKRSSSIRTNSGLAGATGSTRSTPAASPIARMSSSEIAADPAASLL